MDSLDEFFRTQQRRVRRTAKSAEQRVSWARETGTKYSKQTQRRTGLLGGLPGEFDVEERRGSIDARSAMGAKKATLAQLDGDE